jgi:hypothetical protein
MSIKVDFSKLKVSFFLFSSICFIESRLKVGEILDFSTFLNIIPLKCTYVHSTFTLKVIIYQTL